MAEKVQEECLSVQVCYRSHQAVTHQVRRVDKVRIMFDASSQEKTSSPIHKHDLKNAEKETGALSAEKVTNAETYCIESKHALMRKKWS